MKRRLTRSSNCVDIGAHRGTILTEIVQKAPAGVHYAFEPVPRHCDYLRKQFPAVKVYQLALSNIKQEATFIHDLHHPTRSSFKRPIRETDRVETLNVQTDLLDNILPPSLPVHFLKVDVEGAECQVLQGARRTLTSQRPVVIFEHSALARRDYGVAPEDLYLFVTEECGLSISRMEQWLAQQPPLERNAFVDDVMETRTHYFMAHP